MDEWDWNDEEEGAQEGAPGELGAGGEEVIPSSSEENQLKIDERAAAFERRVDVVQEQLSDFQKDLADPTIWEKINSKLLRFKFDEFMEYYYGNMSLSQYTMDVELKVPNLLRERLLIYIY